MHKFRILKLYLNLYIMDDIGSDRYDVLEKLGEGTYGLYLILSNDII